MICHTQLNKNEYTYIDIQYRYFVVKDFKNIWVNIHTFVLCYLVVVCSVHNYHTKAFVHFHVNFTEQMLKLFLFCILSCKLYQGTILPQVRQDVQTRYHYQVRIFSLCILTFIYIQCYVCNSLEEGVSCDDENTGDKIDCPQENTGCRITQGWKKQGIFRH